MALALLGGCATPAMFKPIPGGEAVTIAVAMSPQSNGSITIRNQALGDDMSKGMGSGGLAGGLWGLTCGPFAVLCVPLGAAAGIITGGATGAAVGLTGALPDDKATQLRSRLTRLEQKHPLAAELRRNINERAQKHWSLNSSPPTTRVTVELQDLQLTSTRDEHIRCVVQVVVTVEPNPGPAAAPPTQKRYEVVSPFASLAAWLAEDSDFVDTSFSSASQQIAAQIIADLSAN